jgi:hypothetical protein
MLDVTCSLVSGIQPIHGRALQSKLESPSQQVSSGELTLEAAAQISGVTAMSALRMIQRGGIKARQLCKGAPWVITAEEVAPFSARKRPLGPPTPNPVQQAFEFQ